MADRTTPHVDIQVGDVSHSQLVFGDHNTIQTPKGTKVTILQVGERPTPRLRPMPITRRPAQVDLLGREEEMALAASATPEGPLQLYALDGTGKTCLLKFIAHQAPLLGEGVAFESVRRRTLDEIQAKLYSAFWDCEVPFLPVPAEMSGFLADREARLVLDDCNLDRDDLDALLDSVPRCVVVLASEERTLWSRGTARVLEPLDPQAALSLFERELGGAIKAEERPAAEAVVSQLKSHPQSLVEAAALITDGRISLKDLADNPEGLRQRIDPASLSDSQLRILELLSALGAPLGAEHVSALTGVSDASQELEDLERRGWVKAGSPRYHALRPVTVPRAGRGPTEERLFSYLTAWSREARPSRLADEAEAIEGALQLGASSGRWEETLRVALAAESKLMVAGAWGSSQRVLEAGLRAAREIGDEAAQAHLLHQLGSLSLCLGSEEATIQLGQALGIRERLGDEVGADLTRHNLGQLGGGGAGGGGGNGAGGGGPWRPRLSFVVAGLAAVAIGIAAAVIALAGGGGGVSTSHKEGRSQSKQGGVTTQHGGGTANQTGQNEHQTPNKQHDHNGPEGDTVDPAVEITSPKRGGEYEEGSTVEAQYSCTDNVTAEPSCLGSVPSGDAIDTSSQGPHTFNVTATDEAGNEKVESVTYEVGARIEPTGPTTTTETTETQPEIK